MTANEQHLRRWGIDAYPAQPQSTIKEILFKPKTQLNKVQPQAEVK